MGAAAAGLPRAARQLVAQAVVAAKGGGGVRREGTHAGWRGWRAGYVVYVRGAHGVRRGAWR
eukprot:1155723-Prymnesium_polylepis.1